MHVCIVIVFLSEHVFATFSAVQEEAQLVWELAVIAERVQTGASNTLQRRGKHRGHVARVVEIARAHTDVEQFVSLTCQTLETQHTENTAPLRFATLRNRREEKDEHIH